MRSTWIAICVFLAMACGGSGRKPPTDGAPDLPFPPLGGDHGDGTASLDNKDGGPEADGGPSTVEPDAGMDVGNAGSGGLTEDGGGVAGAQGGVGGTDAAGSGAGGSGGDPDAGTDAGVPDTFVPSGDALVGSWAAQYNAVSCTAEVTEEKLAACDTAGTCAATTLTIDADFNVRSTDLVSMALGSSWSDDTLTQNQRDNLGTESELTLWFVDENHILGRVWSAGSTFTAGFEVCRGLRASREP